MQRQGVNSDGVVLSSAYVDRGPDDYSTYPEGESMTRQEFAEECDINYLIDRYEKVGVISHMNATPPQFLDVSEVPDLLEAQRILAAAGEAFMTLPAKVRREFDNDATQFVMFAQDPANVAKMREWGLAAPEKAPEPPMRVEVVNPAPPAPDVPAAK